MAITEKTQKPRYPCRTQKFLDPKFLPPGQLRDEKKLPSGGNPDAIVVGLINQIPRWSVGTTLKYYVEAKKFPSPGAVEMASEAFKLAAAEWNDLKFGVTIEATPHPTEAHFYLSWWKATDEDDLTLAMAFFPSDRNGTVWTYDLALQPENYSQLPAFFKHELGHVFGLRHEFSIERDEVRGVGPEEELAVQFLEKNRFSVMGYDLPPVMRDSDRVGIKQFYSLANHHNLEGLPVTDYAASIRMRVPWDDVPNPKYKEVER